MNNYPDFLYWCKKNNLSLLQFKRTLTNQKEYCKFIDKNYKTKSMLENVKNMEDLFQSLHSKNKRPYSKSSSKNNKFLLSNLRMSVCELG